MKWIVGTGVGIIGTTIGTGLVHAGLMSAQLASVSTQVNTRIDDMIARSTAEHAEIRTENPSPSTTACAPSNSPSSRIRLPNKVRPHPR